MAGTAAMGGAGAGAGGADGNGEGAGGVNGLDVGGFAGDDGIGDCDTPGAVAGIGDEIPDDGFTPVVISDGTDACAAAGATGTL